MFIRLERAAEPPRVDIVQMLENPIASATIAVGRGPRAALRVWQEDRRSVAETSAWLEEARLEAVLGSCRRSLPSVRCACMLLLRLSRTYLHAGVSGL